MVTVGGSEPKVNIELYKALMQARAEFKPLEKTGRNPHFKSEYATLEDIHRAVDVALTGAGLLVLQVADGDKESTGVTTHLIHVESGGAIRSGVYCHAANPDPQKAGCIITYLRRYSLATMLGLVADEDDDGNAASAPSKRQGGGGYTKPPAGTFRFGKGKGQPLAEAKRDYLEWYRGAIQEGVDDPKKEKYRDDNIAHLAEIDAALESMGEPEQEPADGNIPF